MNAIKKVVVSGLVIGTVGMIGKAEMNIGDFSGHHYSVVQVGQEMDELQRMIQEHWTLMMNVGAGKMSAVYSKVGDIRSHISELETGLPTQNPEDLSALKERMSELESELVPRGGQ